MKSNVVTEQDTYVMLGREESVERVEERYTTKPR